MRAKHVRRCTSVAPCSGEIMAQKASFYVQATEPETLFCFTLNVNKDKSYSEVWPHYTLSLSNMPCNGPNPAASGDCRRTLLSRRL